jgi:4-alpha-glucanotransferase
MEESASIFDQRRAGVLLHLTSLPSNISLGLGTLGRNAYNFVDILAECDLSVWQFLPIHALHRVPLNTPYRDFLSPYQPMSAFAGNPLLIDIQNLVARNWLQRIKLIGIKELESVFAYQLALLRDAYFHFDKYANIKDKQDFDNFIEQHRENWLEDYALFCALKDFHTGACWWNWKEEYRKRDPNALSKFKDRKDKKYALEVYYFEQFVFFTQWAELKRYANDKGVYLFGDMPHFVAWDSVDVWKYNNYFLLDEYGLPKFVSGIAPDVDYFNPNEGQVWGHPVYNWENLAADDFKWWLKRFEISNQLFDAVRLTYFRAFYKFFAIPHKSRIIDGIWELVPEQYPLNLFSKFKRLKYQLHLVTDDIGAPDEIIEIRDKFGFSGMKLLQIAFDLNRDAPLRNIHLPHHHCPKDVIYTGTHDSDTSVGWFGRVKQNEARYKFICDYMDIQNNDVYWRLVHAAFGSVGKLVIIPMQDMLGLGSRKDRMNIPGKGTRRNWVWQLSWGQIKPDTLEDIKKLVERYDRK